MENLKSSLMIVGRKYLESFQSAFTDFTYPAIAPPTNRSKIATGKTLNSLRFESGFVGVDSARIQVLADERYDKIIEGQRPRSVFPGSGQGNSFRLDPDLQEWKNAVGYTGSDYGLALGIFIRGILPTDITGQALEIIENKNLSGELARSHAADITQKIVLGFVQN